MADSSLAMLEETKNAVMGELDLALKVATTPRASLGTYTATGRIPTLAHIRQLLRVDASAIDVSGKDFPAAYRELPLNFLKLVLEYHREIAAKLDRLLQVRDPLQRKRIYRLVGSRDEIESVLEALEDKIEDLEIATDPEVRAGIEQLIDETKAP
jgi:hypothetical protein